MRITCLTVGPIETNCYLLADEGGAGGAVVDPGDEAGRIIEACEGQGLEPDLIVNTHAHADHIGADAELKRRYPRASLCIGRGDAELLGHPVRNLSAMLGREAAGVEPDLLLEDGQTLEVGQCVLRVLETPGHTSGGICLVAADESPAVVLCGDLVFQEGFGRTDLPGGDSAILKRSVEEKVLPLPDETVLLPGHGPATTVGETRRLWQSQLRYL